MKLFPESGVLRDEDEGIKMYNCVLFLRGGNSGITTHLYGITTGMGTWQVCSPIRAVTDYGDRFEFVTRSYNKYVVDKSKFTADATPETMQNKLAGWFDTDKCLKIIDSNTLEGIKLFRGEVTQTEKEIYGLK